MKAPLVKSGSRRRKDDSVARGFCRSTGTPPKAPMQLAHHRLPEQLHLGDIVGRRGQGHADDRDVFPALVLGADNRRPLGRQVLQALHPQGENPPDGLPRQPAAEAIEGGG